MASASRDRIDATAIVKPAPAPWRFWLTPELCPFVEKLDHGEPLTSDEMVEYCRLRGLEDLFFFGKVCFGFEYLEAPLHQDLAYVWQMPNGTNHGGKILGNTRAALMARTNLKTTLCTQAYAVWRLMRNPEERGLIYTHGYGFGTKILSLIKARFEGHGPHGQWFLALYGDRMPAKSERQRWTENMLTIRRQGAYTDASLEATGVGGAITGGHFTFQCIDDLQARQEPPQQILKIKDAYDNLTPMLLAGGDRRIVATHWGFNDVMHHIKRMHPHCVVAQRRWKEDGQLVYSRTDEADVLALFRSNPFLASAWYDNNPRDDQRDGFRRTWFKSFEQQGNTIRELDADGKVTREIRTEQCHCFFFVDPNTGRTETSKLGARGHDYLGLVVLLVGPDNTWYLPRVIRARWSVEQFVDETYTLADYYQPKFIALEQRAAQILFRHIFVTEGKRRNKFLTLVDWKGGTASKEERIKSLLPRYANGMIYHRVNAPAAVMEGLAALEQELLDFPTSEYDDVSDALSAAGPLAYAPGSAPRHEVRAMSAKDAARVALDRGSKRAWAAVDRAARQSTTEFYH